MNKPSIIPLVDVIQLSKHLCQVPIIGDLKYAYDDNFVGRPIPGYEPNVIDVALLAPEAAHNVCQAQNYLVSQHDLGIVIMDAYRPLRAVKFFSQWFQELPTEQELHRKAIHYPDLAKPELAAQGYIAQNVSRHCFGQAVDMVLISLRRHELVFMGPCFDFFGLTSHSTQTKEDIGELAYQNRTYLINAMQQFGFQVHPKEYWHFDFNIRENQEPLDIEISEQLRGLNVTITD
jgi:D-alanyl-D-alanine dipeptidase